MELDIDVVRREVTAIEELPCLVDVVIPTIRGGRVLDRAIQSVENQSYAVNAIFVVDNTSDSRITAPDSRHTSLTMIRCPEPGSAAARNAGIDAATGDLVAFLDDDDEWLPNHIAHAMSRLAGSCRSNVLFAGAAIVVNNVSGETVAESKPTLLEGAPLSRIARENRITTSGVLVSTPLLKRRHFDERLTRSQDHDLWMTLLLDGAKLVGGTEKSVVFNWEPARRFAYQRFRANIALTIKFVDRRRPVTEVIAVLVGTNAMLFVALMRNSQLGRRMRRRAPGSERARRSNNPKI